MLALWTDRIKASKKKKYFHLLITAFDLGDVFCRDPSLGLAAEMVSLKQRQAKLFRGDLKLTSTVSAVGQLFFFSLLLTCPASQ